MRLFIFLFSFVLFGTLAISALDAHAEKKERIVELCQQETNMPDDMCDCVGQKASHMSDQEQSMLVAMMSKDQAASDALRSEMPMESIVKTGMFMVNASKNCAENLHGIDTK